MSRVVHGSPFVFVAHAGLACLLLAACEDVEPEPEVRSCDLQYTGRVLEGAWSLSGHGRRTDCDSRRLEGDLALRTSMPIEVSAMAQATSGAATGPESESEADAFVDRIERADFVLSLAPAEPTDDITLAGAVSGSCVAFDFTETLQDGDELDYHFDGYITASNYIEGEFYGNGPESCEVTGSFSVTIR